MTRVITFLILCALVLGCAFAQTPTGTIQGTIKDATAAVVPDAKVVVIHVETNTTSTLTTDASGHYILPLARPGLYSITVEKTGFQTLRQENIRLDVSQNRTVDLVLQLGAMTEVVRVVAAPPAVDVNSSSVGQVIENRRIMDLPLNGRTVMSLANLTPGVNPTGGGATPGMGGGRNAMSEIQIDGMTNIAPENNVGINSRMYDPQVDAVQEFSVVVNGLQAEYGRYAGGVINMVTKGGSNQLHGTAYEFLRNPNLNANGFINNRNGRARTGSKQNQYGYTVGGPVYIPHVYDGRNKTFFFHDLQISPTRNTANAQATVPTQDWKNGDFSNLKTSAGVPIVIYDPQTVRQDPNNPSKWIRDPFANNIIPSTRIDSAAKNMLAYYPAANFNPTNPYTQQNNFMLTGASGSDDYRIDNRWDQNWSEKWRMFFRASASWGPSWDFNGFGTLGTSSGAGAGKNKVQQYSLDNAYTISPTLILNLRYGFSRWAQTHVPFSDGIDLTELGFSKEYTAVAAQRGLEFPIVTMGSNLSLSNLGQGGWQRFAAYPMNSSLTASMTKALSSHTIKWGGEWRNLMLNFYQYGYPSGSFNFDRNWTQREINTASSTAGAGFASFLLGLGSGGYMTHEPSAASSSSYWAFYLQDDWKVSSKLTLNLGLRYDIDVPRTERYNQYSFFDINAASPLQGQIPASACPACGNLKGAMNFVTPANRHQVPTDKNNLGPRFGFAYAIKQKTVLRGAYGITYAPSAIQAAGTSGTAGMEGYSSGSAISWTFDNMKTVAATLSNPFPMGFNLPTGRSLGASTNLGQGIQDSFFDGWRVPLVQQWNMSVQHSMPGDVTVEVGYIGNHTLHLVDGETGKQYDQVDPSYLPLGTKLQEMVPNPFYGKIPYQTGSLANPTVQYMQLLRPYPQYTGIGSYRKPTAQSIYHGMTIRADKRFGNGMSILLAYTAGKMIDNASSAVGFIGSIAGTHQDSYNWKAERSLSSFDVSQRAVISYIYEFPFGKGKKLFNSLPKALDMMVKGWQANGITTFQTGLPIYITGITNNANLGNSSQRANNNGTSAHIDHSGQSADQRMAKWFDPSVFSQPAAFTFGNVSRLLPDVRNPGINITDLALFKNTYFGAEQRYNFQLRGEAFSAFNHFNLGNPSTNITSGSVATITSGSGTRTIQLAAKILW